MRIGILALQGDFAEHLRIITQCGAEGSLIKQSQQLADIDGLIIPGGESTAIAKLATESNDTIFDTIREKIISGMPVYGTCMGAIFLANEIEGSTQGKLGLMSIKVRRNGFGPQKSSFESYIELSSAFTAKQNKAFHAVFIRAPIILSCSAEVETLARLDLDSDSTIVMARQKNMLVSTFHPELTSDLRIHHYFLNMINKVKHPI